MTTSTETSATEDDGDLARIVGEEERTLGRIQKHLAARSMRPVNEGIDYDAELLSLRDQINEARLEDVPPLIEEMERLSEVAARRAKVTEGAIDPESPYFGRLVLEEGDRRREVLIGKATYVDARTNVRIVDWRDAPVSRIYYRYDEGDEYEESFGGRDVVGEVITRRSVVIGSRVLRRITSPQGVFVRTAGSGPWRRAGESASRLTGGQGAAMRPEGHHRPDPAHRPGRLGLGVEAREDRFLPEITALIDPRQFDLITRTDAGLVIIQGGAGSGKTTIGLHRLAYLAFQDPKRFRADRMMVVVYNDALVRYISRVLPSLGVPGVMVTTFEGFASRMRQAHLRGLPMLYSDDTPAAVTRLEKSPVMLRVIDDVVRRATATAEAWLADAVADVPGGPAALRAFAELPRAALGTRLHRLAAWASQTASDPSRGDAPPVHPVALRHAVDRVVLRARRELLDASLVWAEILTDRALLRAAFDEHAPGTLDDDDLETALRWCAEKCASIVGEIERARDEEPALEDEKREARQNKRAAHHADAERSDDAEPARPKLVARRADADDDEDDEDDDDRSVGIDGAAETAPPMLDREDDALLLRIVQRLRGPLVRGKERIRFEHILVDEAQDLSPVELAVVLGTATKERSVTLAGDTAQRLHMDNGFTTWDDALAHISTRRARGDEGHSPIAIEPLKVQYRSTHPIIELARDVLGPLAPTDGGHAIRDGAPVELFTFSSSGQAVAFLGESLRELMQLEPRASVALIARYPEQAEIYYRGLRNAEVPFLRRIAEQDFPFKPGIDVTDVRQVKGLEFDYVVLLETSRATYPATDESRHLLHIAATRAAHQLWLVTSQEPSELLPAALRERAY